MKPIQVYKGQKTYLAIDIIQFKQSPFRDINQNARREIYLLCVDCFNQSLEIFHYQDVTVTLKGMRALKESAGL